MIEFYNLMRHRKFCLEIPALNYAGTLKGLIMSSYVFHNKDDMQSLMMIEIWDYFYIAKDGGIIVGW
jgi:ribonucleotide reductase alpha subunit